MVKKAYPGTISSVILSVVVVMMLLMPFYVANNRDRLRKGYGEFEYKEIMCFDINNVNQFDNTRTFLPNPHPHNLLSGTGAFAWRYAHGGPRPDHRTRFNEVVLSNVDIGDKPIDGYGRTISVIYPGDPPLSPYPTASQDVLIFFSFTVDEIIENDITRLDFYLDLPGSGVTSAYCYLYDWSGHSFRLVWISECIGKVVSVEITVDDLLYLNSNFNKNDNLNIYWRTAPSSLKQSLIPNGEIIFDMQFYCIEEIKIPTIDYMGIAMIGGGLFMGFCSILMLPHITFRSVIGRIVGKGGE